MNENEGDNITLLCTARGVPEPFITWDNPDGDGTIISPSIESYYKDGFNYTTSTLNISTLERQYSGRYICIASNTVLHKNVVMSRTYFLKVNCKLLGKDRVKDKS